MYTLVKMAKWILIHHNNKKYKFKCYFCYLLNVLTAYSGLGGQVAVDCALNCNFFFLSEKPFNPSGALS